MAENLILEGRYIQQYQIAEGGFANIFRGWDEKENKPIIIKVLKQENFGKNATILEMFVNEADILKKLDHENIVALYDFTKNLSELQIYMLMEYIIGPDVGKLLRQLNHRGERFSHEFTAYIIAETADALDYAHRFRDPDTHDWLRIVHRDVTPSNIMIQLNGQVKLIDFGVAKLRPYFVKAAHNKLLRGKYPYMSPEQVQDKADLNSRSDLFSIGSVFYEMIKGEKLFDINDQKDLHILRAAKVDSKIKDLDCPDIFKSVLSTLLEKNPDERYALAEQLKDILEEFYRVQGYTKEDIKNRLHDLICNLYPGTKSEGETGSNVSGQDQTLVIDQKIDFTMESDLNNLKKRGSFPWENDKQPGKAEGGETVISKFRRIIVEYKKKIIKTLIWTAVVFVVFSAMDTFFAHQDKPITKWGKYLDEKLFPPTIDIDTVPSNAVVYLEGERLDRRTPLSIRKISPGNHTFRFVWTGIGSIEDEIFVLNKEQKKRENIKTQKHTTAFQIPVYFESNPPGAQVWAKTESSQFDSRIGGEQSTPFESNWRADKPFDIEMRFGTFESIKGLNINMSVLPKEDFYIRSRQKWKVHINSGNKLSIYITGTFTKEIMVKTWPEDSKLRILPEQTPLPQQTAEGYELELAVGRRVLEISRELFETQKDTITIHEYSPDVFTYSLERNYLIRAFDRHSDNYDDIEANIRAVKHPNTDNQTVFSSVTPDSLLLTREFNIRFRKSGYEPRNQIKFNHFENGEPRRDRFLVGLDRQAYPLTIIVQDSTTNDPISYATIDVLDGSNNEVAFGTTDDQGRVSNNVAWGKKRFQIEVMGNTYTKTDSIGQNMGELIIRLDLDK